MLTCNGGQETSFSKRVGLLPGFISFSIDEFRIVLGAGQPSPCFFTTEFAVKSNFFTLPVVNDNEIVRSTSDWVEGKSGLICLVRYI